MFPKDKMNKVTKILKRKAQKYDSYPMKRERNRQIYAEYLAFFDEVVRSGENPNSYGYLNEICTKLGTKYGYSSANIYRIVKNLDRQANQ